MLKTTGYSSKSPKTYLLDAGAIYKNIKLDEKGVFISGERIGVTEGGNTFQLEQNTREIPVDGVKGVAKGNRVKGAENGMLTVNLKELTAQNVQMALAGSNLNDISPYYYEITTKGEIELDDYIDNVAFVTKLKGTKERVIIVLENVLNMNGLTIETEDDSEAVVAYEFRTHYDEGHTDLEQAPVRMYWPKLITDVTGVVDDGTNPVEGATVEVTVGTETITATTDAEGKYKLEDIPEGTFTLSATDGTATGTLQVALDGSVATDKNITIS